MKRLGKREQRAHMPSANDESVIVKDFQSPAAEAIQKLQTNIGFASLGHPAKVIGVTSSFQGEGKSTLVCNLANLYAYRGKKTCIVNLDIRRPAIHNLYHVRNRIGIVDYVSGDVDTIDDIIVHAENGVDLINSGSKTPFATNVLESEKLKPVFEELRKRYDFILVDTAPVLMVTDPLLCARYLDGFLFVCAQHFSKKTKVVASVDALKKAGAKVFGIVMTCVTDFSDITGFKESYSYYSTKEEENQDEKKEGSN